MNAEIIFPGAVLAALCSVALVRPALSQTELQISEPVSGGVCHDENGPSNVCRQALTIEITGDHMCDWDENTRYPCTWYGYEFEYQNANPDIPIECIVTRSDPSTFGPGTEVTGSRTAALTLEFPAESGRFFHPSYNTYAPVARRTIVGEVHECSYDGEALFMVEYILVFEPEGLEDEAQPSESGEDPCSEPGFSSFRVPNDLPESAGTVPAPVAGESWDVTNFTGSMVCGGFNVPLMAGRESGSIEVANDGQTLIGTGFAEGTAPITMHAVPGIVGRFAGSVGDEQDGIPMTIDFCWQVITDEWIVGFLRSEVASQGVICQMERDSELRVSD